MQNSQEISPPPQPPTVATSTAVAVKKNPFAAVHARHRDFRAPATLSLPFELPHGPGLNPDLMVYRCCQGWLTPMEPETATAYGRHLRQFCMFYSIDPAILLSVTDEEMKEMLLQYVLHLNRIAVKEAGKPKPGRISVNSVPQMFSGVKDFFVCEHGRTNHFDWLSRKYPKKVKSKLRSHERGELQTLYKTADMWTRPIILLEFCAFVRVGSLAPMQFKHLEPNQDLPNTAFLEVYPDSAEHSYHVIATPEFLADIEELKQYRIRMGENVTGDSYLFSRRIGPRTRRTQKGRDMLANPEALKMTTKGIRDRMFRLSKRCGLDLERLQPSHSIRKAGNTTARNCRVDKDFKEVLMGHISGLDRTYYDISTSESKRELSVEYSKVIDSLTLNDTARVKLLEKRLEGQPTVEELQKRIASLQLQQEQSERDVKTQLAMIQQIPRAFRTNADFSNFQFTAPSQAMADTLDAIEALKLRFNMSAATVLKEKKD